MTAAVVSWISKGQPAAARPEWLRARIIGKTETNGSFMIHTKRGQARVHVGAMVFERNDEAWTCAPDEARRLIAELDEIDHVAQLPKAAGGNAPRRLEAEVADRTDDTDEISAKIAAASGKPYQPPPRRARVTPATAPAKTAPPSLPAGLAPLVKPPAARGAMPSIEWVQLDRLLVDESYQRSVDTGPSRALIQRIGRDWDWRLCVPLMVSRRADGLFVIDGQHRLYGARLRSDVPQLPCCISVYDSPAAEAAMFVAANRERRAMNRLDDFHAAIVGGDPEAIEVKHLVEAAGFTVARKTGSQSWLPGEVAFTSSVVAVLRKHGDAHVREILRALADAFPGQVLVSGGSLFVGLSRIVINPPVGLEKDRLFRALRKFDARGWASMIEGMRGGTDRSTAMRDALLMAYEEAPAEAVAP